MEIISLMKNRNSFLGISLSENKY
jgi:hypothetical protein